MGIGETFRRSLAKLIMREAGDQVKTACGNLQMCAGLKAGIEGATHAVGQQIRESSRQIRSENVEGSPDTEEESERVVQAINNLSIETTGTEEKAAECLEAALRMEVNGDGEGEGEGEEGGEGNQGSLGTP